MSVERGPASRSQSQIANRRMGNTNSKAQTEIITKARELVARGRERYPFPEPDHINSLGKQTYFLLERLENILKVSKPDYGSMQEWCLQLVGVLDSYEVERFYAALDDSRSECQGEN